MARRHRDLFGRLFVPFCSALALTAVCSGCMSAAEHYRRHKDKISLYTVLRDVEPGTTREHVRALLGDKTYESKSHREGVLGLYKSNPDRFPQGVQESDAIIFYPYEGLGLETLIFRDDRLINHNPTRYKKP